MKFFHSISLNKNVCPPEFYAEIAHSYPAGAGRLMFHLEAKAGDEANAQVVEQITALCKERGLDKIRGAYSHLVVAHYEALDLAAAPLLWLKMQKRMIDSDKRDEFGRVVLPATQAKATIKIASIWNRPWIVVSDATRRVLENGGLVGMQFQEVAIKGHSIHASPEPFWELRSVVTLPRMINSVVDTTVDWDPERHLVHGPYGEPHYRQSDIQSLDEFDVAHTFERLLVGEPALFVSQRFYRHCLKSEISLQVLRPARIDPD